MTDPCRIMIVAGEPSGDGLAAKLVNALREADLDRSFEFFGSAGPKMRGVGVEPVVAADDLAIMGPVEIARAMPLFLRTFRSLRALAAERKPDVAILVDFPEFNLKLARSLKHLGIPVVYYVSPQLWGWRKYRRRTIRDHVDLLLTILPFEKDWYAKFGIDNVEYVGSPLVNEVRPTLSREAFRDRYAVDNNTRLIALLPGSRHKEIVRILPPMLVAASLLARRDQRHRFVIPLAPGRSEREVAAARQVVSHDGFEIPPDLVVVKDETHNALNASDAAAVASGTATLEAGIIGTPMAVVYKTSAINYRLVRPLISVDHFGLINLIAGKRLAPELIQDDFTPERLAEALSGLLAPAENTRVRTELKTAVEKLGEGGASRRAAAAIMRLLHKEGPSGR